MTCARLVRGCSVLCVGGLVLAAQAQVPSSLPDPTRPPAAVSGRSAGGPAKDRSMDASTPRPATAPAPAELLVSLVRVHPRGGMSVAVINDRVVSEGDRVAGATVIAIDAQGVVLRTAAGLRRLSLWAPRPAAQPPLEPASAPGTVEPEASPPVRAGKDTP